MKKFVNVQIKKIEIDKWCEGERINNDPGKQYIFNWISSNAGQFRQAWENSLCKDCLNTEQCGYRLLSICDEFRPDQ